VTTAPTPLVALLLVLVVGVALAAALARHLLVATVVFGVYSLGLAMLWVVFRAPDVALTEAAVGAGVTTALLLGAVARTGVPVVDRPFALPTRPSALLAGALVGAALLVTVPALPAVGDPSAPAFAPDAAAAYYLDATATLGIKNVVTAVLVAFRGFDTFGEVAVVFAAGVAVLVVLRGEER
jgi:multicomponent Na+:H+ antiporter subunit B